MSFDEIADAVADLRREHKLPADPARRGPVPLDRFFEAKRVSHVAVPGLSSRKVGEFLVAERYVNSPEVLGDFPATDDPLEGFLYWSGGEGLAFVKADDILPRRRFTAAHELGHAVLHRDRMGCFRADAAVAEGADESTDALEREANRFAAELLMPEPVIRARADELRREHGCCPRLVLAYRLASELLVSREAMHYRLNGVKELGLTDE